MYSGRRRLVRGEIIPLITCLQRNRRRLGNIRFVRMIIILTWALTAQRFCVESVVAALQ